MLPQIKEAAVQCDGYLSCCLLCSVCREKGTCYVILIASHATSATSCGARFLNNSARLSRKQEAANTKQYGLNKSDTTHMCICVCTCVCASLSFCAFPAPFILREITHTKVLLHRGHFPWAAKSNALQLRLCAHNTRTYT